MPPSLQEIGTISEDRVKDGFLLGGELTPPIGQSGKGRMSAQGRHGEGEREPTPPPFAVELWGPRGQSPPSRLERLGSAAATTSAGDRRYGKDSRRESADVSTVGREAVRFRGSVVDPL